MRVGLPVALRWLPRRPEFYSRFWHWTWLFICVAGWMILLHLFEITVWAAFFLWKQAMADWPSALYFQRPHLHDASRYGDLV